MQMSTLILFESPLLLVNHLPPINNSFMFQDLTSLVVDIGTQRSRIGYGGDDAPKMMPYSYVSSLGEAMLQEGQSAFQIGDQSLFSDRGDNEIHSIFHRKGADGYQFDYSKLQPFLEHHLVNEMGVNLSDYSVLLSEDVAAKPHEAKEIRQKMSEFFFDRLNVANIFFLKAPVLSCFATGRSTALVVDSGENFTRSVAVHEGFCLYKSARVVPFAGRNLSKDLERIVEEKIGGVLRNKYSLSDTRHSASFLEFHQSLLLSDIKEALSVRRQDQAGDAPVNAVEYELPDKQLITIERREINDGFLLGDESIDFKGTPALITQTVNGCDVDVKKQLYSNVLLSGGNVLYGSLIEDLLSKIGEHSPANVKVKSVSVCAPSERKHLSWIGGSIVTSLSSFQSYWVGNQEWKEIGSGILDKKCI